jgi:hypothetical protein
VKYFAHYEEDAVIREADNGECFAKLWTNGELTDEYRLPAGSDMRYGSRDHMSIPYGISKEDYDTFGISWVFSEYGPGLKKRGLI